MTPQVAVALGVGLAVKGHTLRDTNKANSAQGHAYTDVNYGIVSTAHDLAHLQTEYRGIDLLFKRDLGSDNHTRILAWDLAQRLLLDSTADSEYLPQHMQSHQTPVVTIADLTAPPTSIADAYLRLHALSHGKAQPNQVNLIGLNELFAKTSLPGNGIEATGAASLVSRFHSASRISPIDTFPILVNYLVPRNVRIAVANRVRLGAFLAPGTTVMHQGFIDYNAGTLGECLIEGHISFGTTVGAGSHIGGGAKVITPPSQTHPVQIGEECLIGANAVVSISLGRRCTVEAGLRIGIDSLITLEDGSITQAPTLCDTDDLLFRRHSQHGRIEVLRGQQSWGRLNPELHQHN